MSQRLRLTKQFRAIQQRGVWAREPLISVGALSTPRRSNRLGLRIRRGMKGSVPRNRAKRLFRAAYHDHHAQLVDGYDILVVLHRIDRLTKEQLEREFLSACRKLGILSDHSAEHHAKQHS